MPPVDVGPRVLFPELGDISAPVVRDTALRRAMSTESFASDAATLRMASFGSLQGADDEHIDDDSLLELAAWMKDSGSTQED
eukprot:5527161-Pyramimonas_sp.AAC.1